MDSIQNTPREIEVLYKYDAISTRNLNLHLSSTKVNNYKFIKIQIEFDESFVRE